MRPWRITVMVSEISITSSSLWVMSTIVSPRSRICRSTCHSSSISGGESTAVGSSRMRILRAAIQRLENLDTLRLADRQIGDESLWRAPRVPSLRLSVSTSRSARAVSSCSPRGELAAEHDVLGDGERGHEHEVLMHHADAGVDGVGGRPAGDVAAVDFHAAGVGRVFSIGEAGLLLAQHGSPLSADSLECLTARTEGWAAGLRLAAISMGTHPDPDRFVTELITEDSALTGYLVEEVLAAQPAEAIGCDAEGGRNKDTEVPGKTVARHRMRTE